MKIIDLLKKHKRRVLWSLLLIPLSGILSTVLYITSFSIFEFKKDYFLYLFILFISVNYGLTLLIDKISSFFERKGYKKIHIVIVIALITVGTYASAIVIIISDVHCSDEKPAIYLYPESDSMISVKLDINGKIIKDIPPYNNGWHVFATKDGLIDGQYDYLFYETIQNKKVKLNDKGWIVKYPELEEWYDITLPKLGLNEKETDQFKEYWLERLPEENYYEIRLVGEKYLEENIKLLIKPKPDTLIRLTFYFKAVDEPTNLEEPQIKTPVRNGFTVVEWGGILG